MIPSQPIDQQNSILMDQRAFLSASVKVAFQGVNGAFGEEAVYAYFEQDPGIYLEKSPYLSFADVFTAVAQGVVEYGVVPIENSQAGSIYEVYDLLNLHDLLIVGEVCIPVNQCLMCLPGQQLTDIRRVYSHPQALAQCKEYLQHLQVETITAYNTAGSAKMIREENLKNTAAIASPRAAELYGLEILARNIQTVKDNYTRFIVLRRTQLPCAIQDQQYKTLLAITAAGQPATLSRCFKVFAAYNLPILRVETRPSRRQAWEYVLFLEIEGHSDDLRVRRAINDMVADTSVCKLLGSFIRTV